MKGPRLRVGAFFMPALGNSHLPRLPLTTRDPRGNPLRRLAYAVQDSGPRRRHRHRALKTMAAIPEAL